MVGELLRDPRIRAVPWRDLTRLSRWEVAKELLLSSPWLFLSLGLASRGLFEFASLASFVFFLTGLRQVHNAFHGTLGLSRRASEGVMFVLSVLMLGSMHAVRYNHMRHHKHCMEDDDVEAMSARMPAWRAILSGPLFPIRIHCKAIRGANRAERRWIWAELLGNVALVALVFGVWKSPALEFHILAMALGQCLASFFCVWTVHHDCDPTTTIARTLRHRLKSWITFNMFYHEEHHLFPQVPTCHLGQLANRLDHSVPGLPIEPVF